MFKLVGTPKRVAFAKLVFDGHQDFDTEEVRAMEKSFADTGGEPLHYPLVARQEGKSTFRVVAGRTRLKALKRAGKKEILVQLVAGEEEELDRASIIENLYRRQEDRNALVKKLVDTDTARNFEQVPKNQPAPAKDGTKRGRPPGPRKAAIKKISDETGLSEDAVRRADNRARAAEKEAADPQGEKDIEEKVKAPIDIHGLDVPADVLKAAEKEQALLDKMSRLLAELKGTYTEYQTLRGEREGLDSGQQQTDALRDAVKAFAAIRKQRPISVCMSCKLWPDLQKNCATCNGTGYMDKEHLNAMEATGSNPLMMEGDDAGVWLPTRGGPQWRTLLSLRGEDV